MSLKYVVLGLLMHQSQHGYELKPEIEKLMGSGAELNPGQLYPLLRKLSEQDLIIGEHVEQEDRPDKRIFSITEKGKLDLDNWFEEAIANSGARTPLFYRIIVLKLVYPDKLIPFMHQHRQKLIVMIGQLVTDRDQYGATDDWVTRALREAAILQTEAELKWLGFLEAHPDP
jgi:DNA-binding PadR family transcriptional regulator